MAYLSFLFRYLCDSALARKIDAAVRADRYGDRTEGTASGATKDLSGVGGIKLSTVAGAPDDLVLWVVGDLAAFVRANGDVRAIARVVVDQYGGFADGQREIERLVYGHVVRTCKLLQPVSLGSHGRRDRSRLG